MTPDTLHQLRFPIGEFAAPTSPTTADIQAWIDEINALPSALNKAVAGLNVNQLETPYRPEGWTVAQVVHHLADSHLNSYVRMKLALTEDRPTIKPYEEARWAELADARTAPIDDSLQFVEALHARWTVLLRAMSEEDFRRELDHPESGSWDMVGMVAMYAWHGRHHVAHITELRKREGWG